MRALIDYFKRQDKLFHLSAGITGGILVVIFIIAQIITFISLVQQPERAMMEIRELVKLEFAEMKIVKQVQAQPQKVSRVQKQQPKTAQRHQQTSTKTPNLASFVTELNREELVAQQSGTIKRRKGEEQTEASAGVSTNIKRQTPGSLNFDFPENVSGHNAYAPSKKRGVGGGDQGSRVGVGTGSKIGVGGSDYAGTGSGTGGVDLTGKGATRAQRGTGGGSGGIKIGIPSAAGGGEAAIDLHALIKWMKAHPGVIPKLVAYDMGHQSDDLSSAVTFTLNGRNFSLFLSCNEIELQLRICLVEVNDFTLLKDSGIKEESNFLTMGNVVRANTEIQSLISSRRAPDTRATAFYQIFWSWWQKQK